MSCDAEYDVTGTDRTDGQSYKNKAYNAHVALCLLGEQATVRLIELWGICFVIMILLVVKSQLCVKTQWKPGKATHSLSLFNFYGTWANRFADALWDSRQFWRDPWHEKNRRGQKLQNVCNWGTNLLGGSAVIWRKSDAAVTKLPVTGSLVFTCRVVVVSKILLLDVPCLRDYGYKQQWSAASDKVT